MLLNLLQKIVVRLIKIFKNFPELSPQVKQEFRRFIKVIITPKTWYLYIVDLEPRVGTKPGKQRPCLAIQPYQFVEAGLESTVVLPLTSKIVHGNVFPLRVRIPRDVAGIAVASDILIDQILAWDNRLF